MKNIIAFTSMTLLAMANFAIAGPVPGVPGLAADDVPTCPDESYCESICHGVGAHCSYEQGGYNEYCNDSCTDGCYLCFGGDEVEDVPTCPDESYCESICHGVGAHCSYEQGGYNEYCNDSCTDGCYLCFGGDEVEDVPTCPDESYCESICHGVGAHCSYEQGGYNEYCNDSCTDGCYLCFGGDQ
eukprot:Clim_evm1s59 gene=Clim_evmTU1s59